MKTLEEEIEVSEKNLISLQKLAGRVRRHKKSIKLVFVESVAEFSTIR